MIEKHNDAADIALKKLLDEMSIAAYRIDKQGRCVLVNRAFLRILGFQHEDEVLGKSIHKMIHYARADGSAYPLHECKIYQAYEDNIQTHVDDEVFWHKDGHAIPVEYWSSPIFLNGEIAGAIVSFVDISERLRAENAQHIAAVAFESHEGMMITDQKGIILRVNRAFEENCGYSMQELVGSTPRIFKSGRHDAAFYAAMWRTIGTLGYWQGEIWDRRKNGEVYPKWMSITAVKNPLGTVTHYVSTHSDISQLKAAESALNNLAFYDPLTELPNRRLLIDRLHQALISVIRTGKHGALLLIDLDHFSIINDTLGHGMGDLLLKEVAKRLSHSVREGDTVARLGADEFVVILEDLSKISSEAVGDTTLIGEKILAALNKPYALGENESRISPSIGVTLFSDKPQSIEGLLMQIDIAMYQAKEMGRNTMRFFDPKMQDEMNARVAMEVKLRLAIEQKDFQLYYQIQVDSTGRALGAETLIRWIDPELGFISPAEFIPLAEETGLILPIGKWVLESACAQLNAWKQEHYTCELVLAVNVSAKQFHQKDFVAQVEAAIRLHDINPKLLKLELTESMLVENIEAIIAKITAIKALGVQFSLDDFGTGYSSLQYLKRLPIDQLKIDQSFVRDLESDSNDRAIVQTIISMAKNMELEVIAEGVETAEQQSILEGKGCRNFQGYLFGKPMPIAQLIPLIALLKSNAAHTKL